MYWLEYVIHRRTGCRRAVSQPSLKAKNTFGTRLQAPKFPSSATSRHLFFLEPVRLGTFPVPELAVKAVRPSSQGRGTGQRLREAFTKTGAELRVIGLCLISELGPLGSRQCKVKVEVHT